MSDAVKIVLGSAATLVGGIMLLVFGEILKQFVIGPIQEFRKTCGEIAYNLDLYANIMVTPSQFDEAAQRRFRELSCKLRSSVFVIPCYSVFALFRVVPWLKSTHDASRLLIGISNTSSDIHSTENIKSKDKVVALLRLG